MASLLNHVNRRMWAQGPVGGVAVTAGLVLGTGAALYKGATSEGSTESRADSAASSGILWGTAGMLGIGGTAMALQYGAQARARWDGYSGGHVMNDIGYGAARNSVDTGFFGAKTAGNRAKNWTQSLYRDLSTAPSPVEMARWKKVVSRPLIGGGVGAVIGGIVGSKVSDDPNKGAAEGAAIGAGAGLVAGRAIRANHAWGKMSSGSRTGLILGASLALGTVLHHSNDSPADRAESEYEPQASSVRDRMSRMGADGSVVLGLHNKR